MRGLVECRAHRHRDPHHRRKRRLAPGHRLRFAWHADRTAKPDPRNRHDLGRVCLASFDAIRSCARRTVSNGSRSARWLISSPAYSFASYPSWRCCMPAHDGPFSAVIHGLAHADGTPNNAVYFWATGLLVLLPRQCADLSCVLRARGWRAGNAHGSAVPDIDGDFARRGVHGRQHLYRQCAELHGLCDRTARRHQACPGFSLICFGRAPFSCPSSPRSHGCS